jgi:hypothetical protein
LNRPIFESKAASLYGVPPLLLLFSFVIIGHVLTVPDSQGFDEYMNVVLDESEEINTKKKTRKPIGSFA